MKGHVRTRAARLDPTTTTLRKPLAQRDENGVSEGHQVDAFFMRPSKFGDKLKRQVLRQFHGKGVNGFKTTIRLTWGGFHPLRFGPRNRAFGTEPHHAFTTSARHCAAPSDTDIAISHSKGDTAGKQWFSSNSLVRAYAISSGCGSFARLPPVRLLVQAARQLPDQSTTLWVESSSTGDTRRRGALNKMG